jgi:hypothetical protein
VPAYSKVSFCLSATNTPSILALLKKEKFTFFIETVVPKPADNFFVAIPTNQF